MLLHPTQNLVAADTHRFRVCCNGRRWGKTTLAIEEIKGKALYHSKRIVYIAPTYQQARDIAWDVLKKELSPIILNINESRLELKVQTKDGKESIIFLRGWESIETLRGQQFDFMVIDEIASMRNFWSSWYEVLRATLTDNEGEVLFISTPKGFNHFYDLFNKEAEDKDYKSFHFTSYENAFPRCGCAEPKPKCIHLPPDELEKAKSEMPGDAFAQEYMADFRKTEGLVYKEFDRERHTTTEEPIKVVEYIAGVDFGFNHPAAIVHIKRDYDNVYWITNEWVRTKRTEIQIAEYAVSCKFNRIYPDPENPSAIQVMNDHSLPVMEVLKGKGSVQSGINKVRELFKQNRIIINKKCKNLILELETYSYDNDKVARGDEEYASENPIKEHDDALDALRYAITGSFELTVRPQEEEDAERLMARLKQKPGLTR